MKKNLIFIVTILFSSTIFGQDIIINFAGTGASTEVTTVEVLNLTNSSSIEIPENASLNLITGTVGINNPEIIENDIISIYPNPFFNSTNIEFYLKQEENVNITVLDITGKTVANYSNNLHQGTHCFEFTSNYTGMYLLNISGKTINLSSKIICMSASSQQSEILYKDSKAGFNKQKNILEKNSKEFSFTLGDKLLLKGISGDYDYATVMVVEPTAEKTTYTFNFVQCQDPDGQNYATVQIGNQLWMAENLNYETENSWWYVNDQANGDIYGRLYTWDDALNACPYGWHLPTDAEWTELTDYLGGTSVAGEKMKSITGWCSPNTGATNSSGFSALPGGTRMYNAGTFANLDFDGYWWSATENFATFAWYRVLYYGSAEVFRSSIDKSSGFSVRCVRD